MRQTLLRLAAALFCLLAVRLCDAQAPPTAPAVTASVTQTNSSSTDAGLTLTVSNPAPPSRPATDVPVTVTIGATTVPATLHFPAVDNHFTGPVTLDLPPGYTVSGLQDGGVVTTDDKGTHLTYQVAALDGGAVWVTTLSVSRPLVDGPGGTLVALPQSAGAITATARPLTGQDTTPATAGK